MPIRDAQPIRWDRVALDLIEPQDPWHIPWQREEGKRGEELFQLILSGIREIYDVNAVIAGGAVRDLAAGVTNHKDVDVFVPINPNELRERYAELGWQGELVSQGKNNGYAKQKTGGAGCFFPTVARFSTVVQGVAVDLVITKEALSIDNVLTFPVFAQRGVWTLENGKMLFPEAQKDIDNKTFTIDPAITDKDRVANVLAKIKEWKKRPAYKDWKVIEPEVKEWWEAKAASEEEKKVEDNPLSVGNYVKMMDRWWDEMEAEKKAIEVLNL